MASGNNLERYKNLLENLFPSGRLWQFLDQPVLKSFLDLSATELCRVDDRVQDLLREADPRVTDELLEDWERLLGLPDECTPDDVTPDERRGAVVEKYTNVGGLSASFYEFVIQQLGFTATVTNWLPFRVGQSTVGDALSNDFDIPFTVGMTVGEPLHNYGWLFYFNVELPASVVEVFTVGDTVGTALRTFSNPLIECTIRKLKPAHAGVTFSFI